MLDIETFLLNNNWMLSKRFKGEQAPPSTPDTVVDVTCNIISEHVTCLTIQVSRVLLIDALDVITT